MEHENCTDRAAAIAILNLNNGDFYKAMKAYKESKK